MRRFLILLAVAAAAGVSVFLYMSRTPAIDARAFARNPTSYVFHAAIQDTALALRQAFPAGLWRGMSFDPGVPPGGDLVLTRFHDPIGKSLVYSVGGQQADYLADFKIHLVVRAPQETEVVVSATLSEVIAGKRFGFGFCGPGFANRYVKVEPTTIEEYEILLRIGVLLHEKDMPALILP